MMKYAIGDAMPRLRTFGRTFYHQETDVLYMNWSCCGVELVFTGTVLAAEWTAIAGVEPEGMPWEETASFHDNHPWLGVFLDDEETPYKCLEITHPRESCLLFCSDEPQTHRIRLVKLTENIKAKLGLVCLRMEGALGEPGKGHGGRIEFIGDSITCGFGNMTAERDRMFYTADENGWYSHGAIAARLLGMEPSLVCVSGIAVARDCGLPNEYGMETLYPYADRILQDALGEERLRKWDFAQNDSGYVVINLGTNDATGIVMSQNPGERQQAFCRSYRRFLETVRACNGKQTHIICALGCLDYYLYADIAETVDAYRRESGDERVSLFRYEKIHPMDGFGAGAHPSLATQKKMAAQIAEEIQRLEGKRHKDCGGICAAQREGV